MSDNLVAKYVYADMPVSGNPNADGVDGIQVALNFEICRGV
jgi:hypothetical protein